MRAWFKILAEAICLGIYAGSLATGNDNVLIEMYRAKEHIQHDLALVEELLHFKQYKKLVDDGWKQWEEALTDDELIDMEREVVNMLWQKAGVWKEITIEGQRIVPGVP